MEKLTIGKTRIPVTVKRNERLKKSRLSVDQHGVLVETPNDLSESRLVAFVEQQKEWVFNQWEELRGKQYTNAWPERFATGAKVLFLGRMNPIQIKRSTESQITYSVRGFQICISDPSDEQSARALLVDYFQDYLENLIAELIEANRTLSSGSAAKIRFTQRKDRWAYCDEKQVLHIGWDLAFLPKKLIEYVLLHELCHLTHRSHGANFWDHLRSVLPDCDERRDILSQYEATLEF